jgi:hypothetical protein
MYSFEDEQQVDVSIKYIYDGVNNQWIDKKSLNILPITKSL